MSVAFPESMATAGARLSRRYPYSHASHASPAAPGVTGEPSSTPPDAAQPPLDARSALLSAFHAPCGVSATCSTPLNFVRIVRAEHGFCAPRHEMVNTLLSKEDKLRCAQRLVERTVSILSTAWKIIETAFVLVVSTSRGEAVIRPYDGSRFPYQSTTDHMPLRQFVHEMLRRSCTNFVTLQTALCYIDAIAARLPTLVREEAIYMLKRAEPGYAPQPEDPEVPVLPSPLLCPRRTFLAAVIMASKFLQDRSYSVRSWSKLTGLHAPEISRCERVLCAALDYRLWVGKDSEPAPTIAGLDMAPVIARDVVYQPEPPRPASQMLRRMRSDIALTSTAAAVDVPMPCPAKQHSLPAFKTLAAAIDEPFTPPPTWGDASLLRLPPMLAPAPTDTQHSRSQPQDADPQNTSSSSLSPGLSCARPSSADSVSSLDPNAPEDLNAGSQGREDDGH